MQRGYVYLHTNTYALTYTHPTTNHQANAQITNDISTLRGTLPRTKNKHVLKNCQHPFEK